MSNLSERVRAGRSRRRAAHCGGLVMVNRRTVRAGHASAGSRSSSKAPAFNPEFLRAFLDEGWHLLNTGRQAEALEIAKRAIRLQETADSKRFFVEAVRGWRQFPEIETLRDVVARAWREGWGTPADLLAITRGLLETNADIGRAIERAVQAWPERVALGELFGSSGLAALSSDPLVLSLLESDKNFDLDLERLLTSVRAGLLDLVLNRDAGGDLPDDALPFCCALARQCFINEYVWDQTGAETEAVSRLRERLTRALREERRGPSPALSFDVAIVAAYASLDRIEGAHEWLRRSWPRSLTVLLDQQLRQPAEWKRIAKSIPQLTTISDRTSLAVKGQYEENPYPRWVRLAKVEAPVSVDEGFRAHFPFSPFRGLGKAAAELDVLIAGCGTGHHALLFAQGFPSARILAVDLSLRSLAYAQQKTREMGLRNISYGQADILELGKLGRTFDIVSSSGVLHHLAEPLTGWRQLLSLLRPGGLMHVGLYSAQARRDIVTARGWLAERGYSSDQAADTVLRRSRQHLAAAARDNEALAGMLKYPDFFSLSEYRDLLFHRQEQHFTLPQIRRFLDENGLQFIGFNIGGDVLMQFRSGWPPEREADLDAWDEFEAVHPHTFQGMYQFWVQRRADAGP